MINSNQVKEVSQSALIQIQIFKFTPDLLGYGEVRSAWSPDANLIAVAGDNRIIRILDRSGKVTLEFPSNQAPRIDALEWDKDNDSLAILTASATVSIWSMGQRQLQEIELASTKDKASFISWSTTHPVLAIGSEKGSVVFFNRKTNRKIPCISKHGKKVTQGDWNKEGNLITASEDRLLTVSNHQGDTMHESFISKSDIQSVKWCPYKDPAKPKKVCAALVGGKSILYLKPETQEHFMFNFGSNYGKAVTFEWFGENTMIIGFSTGVVSMVSTKANELGQELAVASVGNMVIESLNVNQELNKIAVACQGSIRFIQMSDWTECVSDRIEITKSCGKITRIDWTKDGSILTVTTSNGYFLGFLTVIPNLFSSYDTNVALLSSLTEISVVDCAQNNMVIAKTELEIEPSFIQIGPLHFAIGINSSIWYYQWRDLSLIPSKSAELVCKREYFGTIKQVAMNDIWTAVLSDGQVSLHLIQGNGGEDLKLPAKPDKPIVQIYIIDAFLILLDAGGKLMYYLIDDQALLVEHTEQNQITKIFPNRKGTRIICVDKTGGGYFYNPIEDTSIMIPNFSATTVKVLWDLDDGNLFITIDVDKMNTYLFVPLSLDGPTILHLPEYLKLDEVDKQKSGVITYLDKDLKPIILKGGFVYSYARSDGIRGQYLTTHSYMSSWRGENDSDEGNLRYFLQNLATHRFEECLDVARMSHRFSQQFYEVIGKQCLKYVELNIAELAFQMCKNVGMVYSIQSIKQETDKQILVGHIASILFKHDIAQEMFTKSSNPLLALDMRMDLQDWFAALKLAKAISPDKEQLICRRLATQVENQGNIAEAQKLYERAYLNPQNDQIDPSINVEQHNTQCHAGIARTAIKMGNMQRGFSIANELNDKNLVIEIAGVCEQTKQWTEAAKLYQKGGLVEKAASIYIQMGMFQLANPLIDKITSPNILQMVAKAKEAEKLYREAEKAYERANDWENIIRLNLDFLDNPERAKQIFREKCMLPACSLKIAAYCETKGAKKEAIEFLILGGRRDNAFVIAQSHQEMDEYAKIVLMHNDKDVDEHLKIAQYYEGKQMWGKAARHYDKAEQYSKALKLFIADGEQMIPAMIEMVAKVKVDALTHELVDYLMGETDNVPKEPQWTFKLYRAIGNVGQAVKIAINIASQEQELGNYKYAHEILVDTFKDIRSSNMRIPHDLSQRLLYIHSYQLAKRLVKMNDHLGAARLLIRVCQNISQFPNNMVNIMTTTIGECSQANLKQQAYNWSCVLIRPENIDKIPPKFKTKIEQIARRPVKQEDDPEPLSPCPFCKFQIPETRLDCPSCKRTIPFCAASGKHMVLTEWSSCPQCQMCCNYTDMKRVLEAEPVCPICDKPVAPMSVVISSNPEAEFKALCELLKDSGPSKDEQNEDENENGEDRF